RLGEATIAQRHGIFRSERQSPIVVEDGKLVLPFRAIARAAIVESAGIRRVDRHGMAVVVDRAVVVAGVVMGIAAKLERSREVFALREASGDDAAARLDRLVRIGGAIAGSIEPAVILGERRRRD